METSRSGSDFGSGQAEAISGPSSEGTESRPITDPCRHAPAQSSASAEDPGEESDDSMPSLGTISSDDDEPTRPPARDSMRGDEAGLGATHRLTEHTAGPESISRPAPPVTAQAQDAAPTRRSRRSGYDSDGSMPSMLTISDSSEEDFGSEESDEEEDEDEDEDEDEELVGMPPLIELSPSERGVPRSSGGPTGDRDRRGMGLEDILQPFGQDLLSMLEGDPSLSRAFMDTAQGVEPNRPPHSGLANAPSLGPNVLAVVDAITQQMRVVLQPHTAEQHQHEDFHRAQIIIKALEEVPSPLVSRYEQIRKGHDETDEGCAICRDTFLLDPDDPPPALSETETLFEALPFRLPKPRPERILAFPCQGMHLFHAGCLSPWLARRTTCPSCRFDIDPHSMTLRGQRDPASGQSLAKLWAPPGDRGFLKWLEAEESRRGINHPRASTPPSPSWHPQADDDYSDSDEADDEGEDYTDDEYAESPIIGMSQFMGVDDYPATAPFAIAPDVVQSMLAALSRGEEPAMGNEYEDDEFDAPEMTFAPDYDDGLTGLSFLVPGPFPGAGPEEEDSDPPPPLQEVSDDELSLSAEFSDDDDDHDEPLVVPGPRADDPTASASNTIHLSESSSQNDQPADPTLEPITFAFHSPLIDAGSLHHPVIMPGPSPFPRPQHLAARLLSPQDLMGGVDSHIPSTSETASHDQDSTRQPSDDAEPSPIRSLFRNFGLANWNRRRRSRSPPPDDLD